MIEVTEATIGIWQVKLPNGNWLCHAARLPDGGFEILYRFRWYRDDKVWDSRDKKNWWRWKHPSGSATECVSKVQEIVAELMRKGADDSWELLREGRSIDQFMDLLLLMPGISFKHEGVTTK